MNDDFEKRLAALSLTAPPQQWRQQILENASRAGRRAALPWRVFKAGLGLAWAAIVILHLTAPPAPAPNTEVTTHNFNYAERTEHLSRLTASVLRHPPQP